MPKASSARGIGRLALQIRFLAEAAVFAVLAFAARLAPARARHAVGAAFGTVWWAVDARHRRVGSDNVRLAYRDALSSRERRRLVLASRQHFGRIAVETLALPRYLDGRGAGRVRVEGLEHLQEAHRRGKGVVVFTGHLGNWELLMFMLGRLGMPAVALARPLDNPYLERQLVRLRTMTGGRLLDRRGALRGSLRELRDGGLIVLLIDQRPKRGRLMVPFFGVDAHTTNGLAGFAGHSEAAVLPCFVVQEADGSWRMAIEPEVPVPRTGDAGADAYRITADCTAILERWVRSYPDQWLWTHRRWAQPREGAEPGRMGDAGAGR